MPRLIRNRTEGAAPGDWMHVSWDRHYDQRLTVSASPIPDCSQGEETGEKVHIPFREIKVKQQLKKCHEDFEATPILFRAMPVNLKRLAVAKTRTPGLWLTSVAVFTFSSHSWQCLEHRCKNGKNDLLIVKIFPECSSLHKDTA